MAFQILAMLVILATVVFLSHYHIRGNSITPYLLPRLLKKEKHPKAEFRKAGVGWLVFAVWLAGTAISIVVTYSGYMDKNKVLMGVFAFALPIFTAMSLFIGLYYLGVGIFSRSETVVPELESMFEVDTGQLDLYVKKMNLYAKNSLRVLSLLIVSVTFQVLSDVSTTFGILINVACLIAFILLTNRLSDYVSKTAQAMSESDVYSYGSMLGFPASLLMDFYHVYKLNKKYTEYLTHQTDPAPENTEAVPTKSWH